MRKLYKSSDMHENKIYEELLAANKAVNSKMGVEACMPPGYCEAFSDKRYRGATWMVTAIAIFNQMSGVNLITFYSTTLFQSLSE